MLRPLFKLNNHKIPLPPDWGRIPSEVWELVPHVLPVLPLPPLQTSYADATPHVIESWLPNVSATVRTSTVDIFAQRAFSPYPLTPRRTTPDSVAETTRLLPSVLVVATAATSTGRLRWQVLYSAISKTCQ